MATKSLENRCEDLMKYLANAGPGCVLSLRHRTTSQEAAVAMVWRDGLGLVRCEFSTEGGGIITGSVVAMALAGWEPAESLESVRRRRPMVTP